MLLSLAGFGAGSLVVFSFGVCEDVRLQVGRLSKFFVAAIKRTHVRAVSSVNTHMCAQVKVQREPLATALECALERRGTELILLQASVWLTENLPSTNAGISVENDIVLKLLVYISIKKM